MNYAVVKIGAGQEIFEVGKTYTVRGLAATTDQKLKLDRVLMIVGDKEIKFGAPLIDKASVEAKILSQRKGEKITVMKYKPKVRYRRKIGHRDLMTKIEVEKINLT